MICWLQRDLPSIEGISIGRESQSDNIRCTLYHSICIYIYISSLFIWKEILRCNYIYLYYNADVCVYIYTFIAVCYYIRGLKGRPRYLLMDHILNTFHQKRPKHSAGFVCLAIIYSNNISFSIRFSLTGLYNMRVALA